ncbi:MAG: serine protease [Clostridiales bacterium]|nr:serine protease [Clostridiales bacterium]
MGDIAKSDYEFIKEQVIEKRWRKIKKRLMRFAMRLFSAVLFGLIAAVTFVLAEPTIYRIVHKDGRSKSQITLPTASGDVQVAEISEVPEYSDQATSKGVIPETVIQKIDANLSDYKDMYYELRKVAYKVNKSIVKVTSSFMVEDWFSNQVEKTVYTPGLIVAETQAEYYILVSLDRVRNADKIRLKFFDTVYVDAWMVDYENEINLAVIAVNKEDIPPIYLSGLDTAILSEYYSPVVGYPIIALGAPNGYHNSMGLGIITSEGSSVAITDNILKLFNTDIEDNPDGEGVIVNMRGEVIGWITRTLKQDQNSNISTAISVDQIRPYILRMVNQNDRIYFGIKAKDMTEDAKQTHKVGNGIYVEEVFADSPALKADIKNGDIILTINGQNVINTSSFYRMISQYGVGSELIVKIKRTNGGPDKQMDLTVVLSTKPK